MPITREELARRLKHARNTLGFTQADVAHALGVHRPTVSEIEAGRRAVTSEELYRFAQLYGTPVGELLGDATPQAEDAARILLRGDTLDAPEARVAVRRFMERCRTEREIEELLGIEPPVDAHPAYRVASPGSVIEAVRQGEAMAEGERGRLDLGSEPIRNPLELLERHGVRIGPLHGLEEADLDGLYLEAEDLGACVAVNPKRDTWTGFRSAFTAAHEYAHCLLRDVRVEGFRFDAPNGDLVETRANAFAAAFLMPADGVRDYFALAGLVTKDGTIDDLTPADIVRAMDYFGVSRPALLFRLQNVGLLDADTAARLRELDFPVVRTARALGLRMRREEQPGRRLASLATRAWQRGLISTGRAADLLGLDLDTFRERMRRAGIEPMEDDDLPVVGAAARE